MSEEIKQTIFKSLQDLHNYSQNKPYRASVKTGNKKIMTICQEIIVDILNQELSTPISKLLAVRFAKDLVETFNDDFISAIQFTILPALKPIAMYKKESKDEDRGKSYFVIAQMDPTPELRQLGDSLLRLTLECVYVWSKWFPIEPETGKLSLFRVLHGQLKFCGVTFPQLTYFQVSEVKQNLPETGVPREMLAQLRILMRTEARKGGMTPLSELHELFTKKIKVSAGQQGNLKSAKTYSDYFQFLWKTYQRQRVSKKPDQRQPMEQQVQSMAIPQEQPQSLRVSMQQLQEQKSELEGGSLKYDMRLQNQVQYLNKEKQSYMQIINEQSNNLKEQKLVIESLKRALIEQGSHVEDDQMALQQEHTRQLRRKEQQIQQLQNQVQNLSESAEENQSTLIQVTKQKEKLQLQYESQLSQLETMGAQLELSEGKVQKQNQTIQKLNEQLAEYRDKIKSNQRSHQQQISQLNGQVQELQNQLLSIESDKFDFQDELCQVKQQNQLLQQQLTQSKKLVDKLQELNKQQSVQKEQLLANQQNLIEENTQLSRTVGNSGFSGFNKNLGGSSSIFFDLNTMQLTKLGVKQKQLLLRSPQNEVWYDDSKIQIVIEHQQEQLQNQRLIVILIKNISQEKITNLKIDLPLSKGLAYSWKNPPQDEIQIEGTLSCSIIIQVNLFPYTIEGVKITYNGIKIQGVLILPVTINNFLIKKQSQLQDLQGIFTDQTERVKLASQQIYFKEFLQDYSICPLSENLFFGYFQVANNKQPLFVCIGRNIQEFQIMVSCLSPEVSKTFTQQYVSLLQ